ncbi:MAG: ChaN family lipoprotein [Planctomycetota bacterium]
MARALKAGRSAHADLVALQKRLVDQLEQEIDRPFLPNPGEDAYADTYRREFERIERVSSKNELVKHIRRSSLLYIADCHTLAQAQRAAARLLAEVNEDRARPMIIGLEMLQARHQQWADRYLAGEIKEQRFLEAIDYDNTWGFPWANFRQFFDVARSIGAKVVGLNCDAPGGHEGLVLRDRFAADLIVNLTTAFPDALIVAVYGDLHIASKHLPGEVASRLAARDIKRRHTQVFQNADPVYWELARQRMQDSVEVVKLGKDRFCVLSATPLARIHSYLHGPGALSESLSSQIPTQTGRIPDRAGLLDDTGIDITESTLELIQTVADYFRLPVPDLSRLSVIITDDPRNMGSMDGLALYSEDELTRLGDVLRRWRAAWLERTDTILFATASMDHAAEEATRFLHSMLSRPAAVRRKQLTADDPELTLVSPQTRDVFYQAVMASALAWLGSKLINHKRQTDRLPDFQAFLATWHGRRLKGAKAERRDVARLVVRHKELESRYIREDAGTRRRFVMRTLTQLEPAVALRLARALGGMLGEAMYGGIVNDRIDRSEVRELFMTNLRPKGAAFDAYLAWVARTRDIRGKFRARAEQV